MELSNKWNNIISASLLKSEKMMYSALDRGILNRANFKLISEFKDINQMIQKKNKLNFSAGLELINRENFESFPILKSFIKSFIKKDNKGKLKGLTPTVKITVLQKAQTDERIKELLIKGVSNSPDSRDIKDRPKGSKKSGSNKGQSKGRPGKGAKGGRKGSPKNKGKDNDGFSFDKMLKLFILKSM